MASPTIWTTLISSTQTVAMPAMAIANHSTYSHAGSTAPSSLPHAICQGERADRRCQSQVFWLASSARLRPASTLP